MTEVVVWPHPVRIVGEHLPEQDRDGFVAVRWVRPFPVRRVLAQMRYPSPPYISPGEGRSRLALWWDEMSERGRMECTLGVPLDDELTACLPLGQILRLPSDRKFPYDPAREAEDILATLITGTGAVPVADRLLASLEDTP